MADSFEIYLTENVDSFSLGGGDMLKSIYDSSNSGVVDDSQRLGGELPSFYYPSSNPSGFVSGDYYTKDEINDILTGDAGIDLSGYATVPFTTGISGDLQSQIDLIYIKSEIDSLLSGKLDETGKAANSELLDGNDSTYYYPASNPSGFIDDSNIVFDTGNQTINGTKTFSTRPTVNGTGVLLSGEAANGVTSIESLTGDLNFVGEGSISIFDDGSNTITISGSTSSGDGAPQLLNYEDGLISITDGNTISLSDIVYLSGDQAISGQKSFTVAPTVDGNPLLTGVDLSSYALESYVDGASGDLQTNINAKLDSTGVAADSALLSGENSSYYLDFNNLNNVPTGFTPESHTHDDRYYTETETDSLLSDKLDVSETGLFYLASNPSGFITGVDLSSYSTISYVNNVSGDLQTEIDEKIGPTNVVFATGDQTINGTKTFSTRPEVNGSGVLLVGEAANGVTSLESLTGDVQLIGLGSVSITDNGSSQITISGATSSGGGVPQLLSYDDGSLSITDGNTVDLDDIVKTTGIQEIDGQKSFTVAPTLSGNQFITGVDLTSYATEAFATGISGDLQASIDLNSDNISELQGETGNYSQEGHTHDDRYYTELETDNLLTGKLDISETGNFYSVSNPSGFITGVDLSNYATIPYVTGISGDLQLQINENDNSINSLETATGNLNGRVDILESQTGDYSINGHTHDDRYYTESEIDSLLTGKLDATGKASDSDLLDGQEGAYYLNYNNFSNIPTGFEPISHNHDDLYYRESEIDSLLNSYATEVGVNEVSGQLQSQISGNDLDITNLQIATGSLQGDKLDATGKAADSELLDGQEGSYYLDFDNITGVPSYALESYVDTASGSLQGQISSNTDDINILQGQTGNYSQDGHTHDDRYYTEGEIDSLLTNKLDTTGQAANSVQLEGQDGAYYLDYNNLTSVPTGFEPISHTHDDRYYTESESDSLFYSISNPSGFITGVDLSSKLDVTGKASDSDLLDGESGAYYLDYGNLTNVPTEFAPESHTHTISEITDFTDNSSNWDAAYADKINSMSFNTGDGVLTLSQQDGGSITEDLDGRYLLHEDITGKLDITGQAANSDQLDGQEGSYYLDYGNLTNVPTGFTPTSHTHDDRYYTESEVDTISGNLQSDLDSKINATNVVFTTGDQTIGGEKDFSARPTVNGTGVLLSGEGGGSSETTFVGAGNVTVFDSGDTVTISGSQFIGNLIDETSVWIDVGAMVPDLNNPPEADTISGIDTVFDVYTFAGATTPESVYFKWSPPARWDNGPVNIDLYWVPTSGSSGDLVSWEASAGAISFGDDWNISLGDAVSGEIGITNSGDIHILGLSGISVGGDPQDEDVLIFKLTRNITTSGSPALGEDVNLWGAKLSYDEQIPVNNPYTQNLLFAVSDETSEIDTDTDMTFRMPLAFNITSLSASVTTAPSGQPIIVDITKNGTSIFNSGEELYITTGDTISTGLYGLSSNSFAEDDEVVVDTLQVGSTYAGAGLKVYFVGETAQYQLMVIAASDETSDLEAGSGVVTFRVPFDYNVVDVKASLGTAPSGQSVVADINADGTSIFSSPLVIPTGEKMAISGVITGSSIAANTEMTVDIDQVGTAGAGLKLYMIGNELNI